MSVEKGEGASISCASQLVLQHLIRGGFYDVAVRFAQEAHFSTDLQRTLKGACSFYELKRRSKIRGLIWDGKFNAAEVELLGLDQSILLACPELQFHLRKLCFIEMFRDAKVADAIQYAQDKLAPLVESYEAKNKEARNELRKELEEVMALLVFDGAKEAQISAQAKDKQRRQVAFEVNEYVLKYYKLKAGSSIELLLKEFVNRSEFYSKGSRRGDTTYCGHSPPDENMTWKPFETIKYNLRDRRSRT